MSPLYPAVVELTGYYVGEEWLIKQMFLLDVMRRKIRVINFRLPYRPLTDEEQTNYHQTKYLLKASKWGVGDASHEDLPDILTRVSQHYCLLYATNLETKQYLKEKCKDIQVYCIEEMGYRRKVIDITRIGAAEEWLSYQQPPKLLENERHNDWIDHSDLTFSAAGRPQKESAPLSFSNSLYIEIPIKYLILFVTCWFLSQIKYFFK